MPDNNDDGPRIVGEHGPELVRLPEDVVITCAGSIYLPPIGSANDA